jgi:integrase
LEAVDLHGAQDLRHTFSTWLEDAGIPARVIDELMGHQATGRAGRHQASAIAGRLLATDGSERVREMRNAWWS